MEKKVKLMVGPTEIPMRVLNAMGREVITHRSKEYMEIHRNINQSLKELFNTKNDVIILTTSGTGAMETAIQNCFSKGDEVVVPIIGHFSERFATISEIYGLVVKRVMFEAGDSADVELIMESISPSTKGLLVVHNESSTGVFNNLEEIGKAIKDKDILFIVDSVSGIGGLEFKMDEWNIDIALTASQKSLMSPPGLALMGVSDKAYEAMEKSQFPKYYFDLRKARKSSESNQTPWTPSIYSMFAMEEALKMINEEGLSSVYNRHLTNRDILIDGLEKLGFELFAKDKKYASPTLTTIKTKINSKIYVDELKKHGFIIAGGIEPYAENTLRIGTMGYVSTNDIVAFLEAFSKIVKEME